jgi:hypothetical protein
MLPAFVILFIARSASGGLLYYNNSILQTLNPSGFVINFHPDRRVSPAATNILSLRDNYKIKMKYRIKELKTLRTLHNSPFTIHYKPVNIPIINNL